MVIDAGLEGDEEERYGAIRLTFGRRVSTVCPCSTIFFVATTRSEATMIVLNYISYRTASTLVDCGATNSFVRAEH